MATSRSVPAGRGARRNAVDLCWGAWAELGVSGWARTHHDWAIDPEPLIVFTSTIGSDEPRLRDEALDWCIRNWRYVSLVRLRRILADQDDDVVEAWGEFAATVNIRAGVRWPEATSERAAFKVTGRSTLRSLTEPSMVFVRMRAIFGLASRTEILRYLLFADDGRATAAMLAEATNYAKRNVAEACESLVDSGILSSRGVRNRLYFSLADIDSLARFVGTKPAVAPDWNALLRLVRVIVKIADIAAELPQDVVMVETHEALRDIGEDLDILGLRAPRKLRGTAVLPEWDNWSHEVMSALAAGKWPSDPTVRTSRSLPALRR